MIPLDTHQEQIKHSRSVNAQTNNLLTFVNISSYIPHESFFLGGGVIDALPFVFYCATKKLLFKYKC